VKKHNQDTPAGPTAIDIPSVVADGPAARPKGPALGMQALRKPYETPHATRGNT
jgi:hypothetical protein